MFVLHLASILVSLVTFSAATPTADDCSQLTQPLTANELHQILGRWILIEGFSNNDIFDSVLENLESQWMVLNTTADSNILLLDQKNPVPGMETPLVDRCLRFSTNVTIIEGKVLQFHLEVAATYHRFLQTCPDCLLMHIYTKENNYESLTLFGRNTTLAASDLEAVRKQAACLQFPLPAKFHYDTNKELCPF